MNLGSVGPEAISIKIGRDSTSRRLSGFRRKRILTRTSPSSRTAPKNVASTETQRGDTDVDTRRLDVANGETGMLKGRCLCGGVAYEVRDALLYRESDEARGAYNALTIINTVAAI